MKPLPIGEAEFHNLAHIARGLEFFSSLKGAKLEKVLAHIEFAHYDKGETIFKKGGLPEAFYIINQGSVRIHLGYRFLGLFRQMAHLKAGDLFGEMALLENRIHSGTAKAEESTTLFILPRDNFHQLLKTDPEFADLMRFVVSRRKPSNTH
jgi:CRP/FNR family cyclic AMP-dependent transcriptional regulator